MFVSKALFLIMHDCLDAEVTSVNKFVTENSTSSFSVAELSVHFGHAPAATNSTLVIIKEHINFTS